MTNKCVYTGSSSNIPDYKLGTFKKINAGVEKIENGKRTEEKVQRSKWELSDTNFHVKNYNISLKEGKYEELSENDYKNNPLELKIWQAGEKTISVNCQGVYQGTGINIQGHMDVRDTLNGEYKSFDFEPLIVVQEDKNQPWEFWTSIELEFAIDAIDSELNGEIGVIHLAKSLRKHESGEVYNSGDEYHLYPDNQKGGEKNPIAHKMQVKNGRLITGDNNYSFLVPIIQTLEPNNKRYTLKEYFQTYIMFKPDGDDSIWIPIKVKDSDNQKNLDEICGFIWGYEAVISYDTISKEFFFEYANRFKPQLEKIHHLPTWDGYINHYANF
jgi:hypothetical protein